MVKLVNQVIFVVIEEGSEKVVLIPEFLCYANRLKGFIHKIMMAASNIFLKGITNSWFVSWSFH